MVCILILTLLDKCRRQPKENVQMEDDLNWIENVILPKSFIDGRPYNDWRRPQFFENGRRPQFL